MMRYRHLHGYKYELLSTVAVDTEITGIEIESRYISLFDTGRLFIKERYAWDGPSGPTFDTKTFMRGSLVHDALYQLMREGVLEHSYREYADRLLKQICIEDGMCRFRAWYVYHAVRMFAEKNSLPEKKPRGKEVEI